MRAPVNFQAASRLMIAALLLLVTAISASAETLMMPKRDARMGVSMVVWGVTTQANGSPYTMDFGDGTSTTGNVGDRSYIAFNKTYATAGTFTATLTVGVEVATVNIRVFNVALLPGGAGGDANRGLGINMAIEDGLRFLWTAQNGRAANFPANTQTNWGSIPSAETALVTLAFQNHGYKLPADPLVAPSGVYQKYIVQRGLNYVIASQTQVTIGNTPQGDNPCVGLPLDGTQCIGLYDRRYDVFHQAYTTALAILPLASSGALSRTVALADVPGNLSSNFVVGKTYGQILQRQVNAMAWGQLDSSFPNGRGGWYYDFRNSGSSDGSTVGWVILSMLDAAAAGAVVPTWVTSEFVNGLAKSLNTNGTLDYQSDGNAGSNNSVGPQKNGIGLQGLYWIGETTGARVTSVTNTINSWWGGVTGTGGNSWGGCSNLNKGCGYTMFNNFKGLKLQGITTLPAVTRPAGPGAQPAGDWYADYQDWFVANQTAPNTTTGGNWNTMGFSCCYTSATINAAVAELILSPVALVLPDEAKFAAVGLSPGTNTAPYGGSHTVTATAESTGGTPVPGATVTFTVLSGPNAGQSGTATTGSNGLATFTYADAGGVGTDTIQATIGTLNSNIVDMTWTPVSVSATITAADKVYDGTTAATITGCTLSGVVGGDAVTCDVGAAVGTFADSNVGSWSVTGASLVLTGAHAGNYVIGSTLGATASITPAPTTTVVTCTPTVTYTGAALEVCTANATGAGGLNEAVTPVTYTNNVDAGTAGASATYAGDANHSASTGTASFTITPAATSTVVTCTPSVTYTGAALEVCTANVTGAGGLNEAVTTVTYTDNVNAGTANASATYAGDANHTTSTGAANFTIAPAPTTTVVTCTPSVMYTSGAHTVCTANVTGAGGLNEAVTPVTYTNNVNVGTAGASATYAGDANHSSSTGTANFAITPAPLTVTAGSYTRSYLAADPVLTGTLTGVLGADGITATYSSTGTGSQVPGVYPTVPALVDPNGKLGNYSVTPANGTLTITNGVPVCTIAPSITSIWPPNHKMVSVTASGATDVDGGPLTYSVVSIFQDEPTNTTGDGNTAIDGAGIGTSTAQVRAERTGDPKTPGDGRVYHITFSVTDSLGLSCQSTVQVGVPHDQSGKVQPVDGGALFNSTVAGAPAATTTSKGKGK